MNFNVHEPICRAFSSEPTTAGGAKEPVIANFFLAIISIFATETLYAIPLFIGFHFLIIYLTKKEPKFFRIFINHLKFKNHYF